MKKLWFKLSSFIIKFFGNVQLFPYPFFCLLWGDTHYRVGGPETRKLLDALKPGDIILRRYDRYMSGWFIPGFWTHVGLMLTEDIIIHATTKGVITEDILTFLRTDHVKVLRVDDEEAVRSAIDTAPSLMGKEYDFVFDSTDDTRLYCSELIKYCYPKVFDGIGKGTIPPDDLMKADLRVIHDSKEFRKQED